MITFVILLKKRFQHIKLFVIWLCSKSSSNCNNVWCMSHSPPQTYAWFWVWIWSSASKLVTLFWKRFVKCFMWKPLNYSPIFLARETVLTTISFWNILATYQDVALIRIVWSCTWMCQTKEHFEWYMRFWREQSIKQLFWYINQLEISIYSYHRIRIIWMEFNGSDDWDVDGSSRSNRDTN